MACGDITMGDVAEIPVDHQPLIDNQVALFCKTPDSKERAIDQPLPGLGFAAGCDPDPVANGYRNLFRMKNLITMGQLQRDFRISPENKPF